MAAARGGSTRPAKSSGKQHRPIKRGRWHPITAIQRPWQAMPLRTRLTLMTTGLLAIGLIVVSFVVTSLLYSHMMGQIDSQLRTTSVAIGSQGLAQIREGGTSSTTPLATGSGSRRTPPPRTVGPRSRAWTTGAPWPTRTRTTSRSRRSTPISQATSGG